MNKLLSKLVLLFAFLIIAGTANAATVNVSVYGRTAPWMATPQNIALGYNYGYSAYGMDNFNLAPTSVGASSGLNFVAGNTLSISYLSGLISTDMLAINREYFDANGNPSIDISIYPNNTSSNISGSPIPAYVGALMGTFADAQGTIVGNPFVIGNGPFNAIIPVGSSQLLLGINDGFYNDNFGKFDIQVADAPVPEPSSMVLGLMGLGSLLGIKKRKETV